jgi:predicted flap endonuclease-1-like 5' DNA nuclease
MRYTIYAIEGIGPSFTKKLAAVGISNTDHLLARCGDRKGRRAVSKESKIAEKKLLAWANMADLMRINGIGRQFAEILEVAGVDTVKELRNRNAANLHAKMVESNRRKKVARQLPSVAMLEGWIKQAKKMKPVITH